MNHLIDTDDKEVEDPELHQGEDPALLKFLETLIEKSIKRLEDKSCKPRIQDALKAIQLKQKMVKTSEAEKIFWQEIEAIRREVLPKLYTESINLEAQIQSTIIGLKQLVKNGILPVKTITDTFNQGKSKESQLTYHRIGRLLSSMGFRKAKTQTGTYAILWDDNLLSQNTFSNDEKNVKQPPVSPVSPASQLVGQEPQAPDLPLVLTSDDNKKPRFFKRGSSMRLNHLLQFNYIYSLGSFGTLCGIETNSVSLIQTLIAL